MHAKSDPNAGEVVPRADQLAESIIEAKERSEMSQQAERDKKAARKAGFKTSSNATCPPPKSLVDLSVAAQNERHKRLSRLDKDSEVVVLEDGEEVVVTWSDDENKTPKNAGKRKVDEGGDDEQKKRHSRHDAFSFIKEKQASREAVRDKISVNVEAKIAGELIDQRSKLFQQLKEVKELKGNGLLPEAMAKAQSEAILAKLATLN